MLITARIFYCRYSETKNQRKRSIALPKNCAIFEKQCGRDEFYAKKTTMSSARAKLAQQAKTTEDSILSSKLR